MTIMMMIITRDMVMAQTWDMVMEQAWDMAMAQACTMMMTIMAMAIVITLPTPIMFFHILMDENDTDLVGLGTDDKFARVQLH